MHTQKKTKFIAIAACSENYVIGLNNKIPWHLPEDFRWFKQTTMNHTVVMGRKTFEAIGKPLPQRRTIVLSRHDFKYPGVDSFSSLDALYHSKLPEIVFIVGGGEIYKQALPVCKNLFLTLVRGNYRGDTFFPRFQNSFSVLEIIRETNEFMIINYVKNQRFKVPRFTQDYIWPHWGFPLKTKRKHSSKKKEETSLNTAFGETELIPRQVLGDGLV
jgi:dihydrofolate reductase